jgi:hypothetical protein
MVMPFWKLHYPDANFRSPKQDQIILEAYINKGKIDYKSQDVYKNERSFKKAMSELIKQHIIAELDGNDFYDIFRLTNNGWFYAKKIILK